MLSLPASITTQRLAVGGAQLTLSNIFVRLLSLVSMPVLTHLLDPSAYGSAAIVTTLISLISAFALFGAEVSYVRAFHGEGPASRQAVEALTWRFALGSSFIAAIAAVALWAPIASTFSLPAYAGWLTGAGVIFSIAMAMAEARARLHSRYFKLTISTAGAGLGSMAITIGIAYFWRRDELPLIISMLAGFLIPVLILGIPPLPVLLKSSGLNLERKRHILGVGLASIVTAPAYWAMASSDRWVLGYFQDATTVGIYSVGYSVAIAGMTVNNAIAAIWTPEATRLFEDRTVSSGQQLAGTTEALVAVLACVWLAVAAAGGDILRLLSAPAYHSGVAVIPLIAGAVFFHGIARLASTVYLLEKRVHRTIWWWASGAIASLLFNIALIPKVGMLGAALSQLLAFMIVAAGMAYNGRKMLTAHINWHRLLLVILTVVAAALFMVPAWAEKPLTSLGLKLPCGLLVTLVIVSYFAKTAVIKTVMNRAA